MPAYVVAEVEVTDAKQYEEYRKLSTAAFKVHSVKPIARGGATTSLEGASPKRIVILEFTDVAHAQRWYESEEYRLARAAREGAAKMRMYIVDGA